MEEMATFEVNFDGLVGPSHNYAGLSFGNVASTTHREQSSNPREAALQGLGKMKLLASLGLKQGILPPQERPYLPTLRQLGFSGTDDQVIERAGKQTPEILAAVCSASSMWTANAATVSPSADTGDGKVHFTPANLSSKFHRSIEPDATARALQKIFSDPAHFVHHAPLPSASAFGDEGAANHTRFSTRGYGGRGLEFFVFGRQAFKAGVEPKKFPARQTLEASQAIARLHRLDEKAIYFAQQSPEAIDAGVFHNDVASVGNEDVFFYHEQAFVDGSRVIAELGAQFQRVCGKPLRLLPVRGAEVSMQDAVKSYLFNSQLISSPARAEGKMQLVAPSECAETPSVKKYLDSVLTRAESPLEKVHYLDLRQSMNNGGGPACLRLRVVLNDAELASAHPGVIFTDALHDRLVAWVKKHYRDRLAPKDIQDPALWREGRAALDELTSILNLGAIYSFQ